MLEGRKVKISTGGNFDPIPMDRYTVQIKDVNLVTQLAFKSTQEEEVLNYQFVVLDEKMYETSEKEQASTRGRYLWKRCRLAMNQRSWLYKLAKAVIGRDLTKEEVAEFDPESIIGKQVDVMVEQQESKDGQQIYLNIVAFSKNIKKLEPFEDGVAEKPVVVKSTKPVVPAEAPKGEEDPEEFINNLEEENKVKKVVKKTEEPEEEEASDVESEDEEEETPEELELKLKLARAKAKAAKAKKAKK